MGGPRRPEGEQDVRALKVDVPAELRLQLKREALELDVSVREYVQSILENRLPADTVEKVVERAKAEGLSYRDFMLRLLREAGIDG